MKTILILLLFFSTQASLAEFNIGYKYNGESRFRIEDENDKDNIPKFMYRDKHTVSFSDDLNFTFGFTTISDKLTSSYTQINKRVKDFVDLDQFNLRYSFQWQETFKIQTRIGLMDLHHKRSLLFDEDIRLVGLFLSFSELKHNIKISLSSFAIPWWLHDSGSNREPRHQDLRSFTIIGVNHDSDGPGLKKRIDHLQIQKMMNFSEAIVMAEVGVYGVWADSKNPILDITGNEKDVYGNLFTEIQYKPIPVTVYGGLLFGDENSQIDSQVNDPKYSFFAGLNYRFHKASVKISFADITNSQSYIATFLDSNAISGQSGLKSASLSLSYDVSPGDKVKLQIIKRIKEYGGDHKRVVFLSWTKRF